MTPHPRRAQYLQESIMPLRYRVREIRDAFKREDPAFATVDFDLVYSLCVGFLFM